MSILDSIIWKVHASMEKFGFLGRLKYSMYKNIEYRVPIKHQYPVNFKERDLKLFSHYTNYDSSGENVFKFENINVSYDGILFKGMNNAYHSIPHVIFRADYGWLYILKNYFFNKKIKGVGDLTYVLIYDFWSAGNYYHWLVDTLPRLLVIKEELKQKNYSLLIPADCREFIKRTLTYFEINQITYIKRDEFIQVKQLFVPYYLVGSGHIHPPMVYEVKQFFNQAIKSNSSLSKIYVSRGRQKARKVVNEDQIIKIVEQFGFKVIYFEDYTFEQQVEIGKVAKYFVSSHGANLTNMMFMNDGSRVLELIKSHNPNFCYWGLANAAKVDYYYQLCEVIGNDHLFVDIELFKLNLQLILND